MSARTARVFEHEKIRVGAPLRTGGTQPLTFEMRHFEALARFGALHDERYFKVGHRQIAFQQYVGYLQAGDLAFEVLPKVDRVSPGDDTARWRGALLEMLRVAGGMTLHTPSAASQGAAPANVFELVAAAFLQELERLLREGLAKAYRSREQNGHVFRGRLLVSEDVRVNAARADRFFVRVASYEQDIPINRVLREAVNALSDLPLSAGLRGRASAASLALAELTPIQATPAVFDRIVLGRPTERYRRALTFARLLLEHRTPNLRGGALPVFALLFDMNVLWERYVAVLIRRALPPGCTVSTQESLGFWSAEALPTKTIRPDILIRSSDGKTVLLVADTKWKAYAGGAPADADLKQMFVYNELFACADSLLIYPAATTKAHAVVGRFGAREHVCRTRCLGLFDAGGMCVSGLENELKIALGPLGQMASSATSAVETAGTMVRGMVPAPGD